MALVDESVKSIMEYEGYEVEEAQLTYRRRENLPSSAFCGPNRTYPAHDKSHIRSAIQRLSQFGGKLAPATRLSIFRCLKRRAKRMGIEISEDTQKKLGKSVEESVNDDSIIDWYINKYYPQWVKINADT